jgi:PhzF family phenazine biosynthesis protein
MGLPLVHVDAFTDRPFAGNPAAVCLLPAPAPDGWLQRVAAEMNLSETAFVCPRGDDFDLRWFSPTVEVDLCGHATLASAHVLWESGRLAADQTARFHTRSGLLTAVREGHWIYLDFPATPERPLADPRPVADALGITPRYVGCSRFDYLAELDDEDAVRGVRPDFALLRTLPVRGVMVTSAAASTDFDFVSRFFAPAVGIDEDPVTGSAHCCLGPFWAARLGRPALRAYQASARGGTVEVRSDGDRVRLGGQAVTVLRGELCDAVGPDCLTPVAG